MKLENALALSPIVAILRGVKPDEAVAVGEALVESGIVAIEVPLNSPSPYDSIRRLAQALGDRAAIGAGTVLDESAVSSVAETGATFIVAPDTRTSVIRAALASGLEPVPGFATPTEAFRALRCGARFLKLFPASSLGLGFLQALRAVLPKDASVIAVGGVDEPNLRQWLQAGAIGLGTGSSLYRAGMKPGDVAERARAFTQALRTSR